MPALCLNVEVRSANSSNLNWDLKKKEKKERKKKEKICEPPCIRYLKRDDVHSVYGMSWRVHEKTCIIGSLSLSSTLVRHSSWGKVFARNDLMLSEKLAWFFWYTCDFFLTLSNFEELDTVYIYNKFTQTVLYFSGWF